MYDEILCTDKYHVRVYASVEYPPPIPTPGFTSFKGHDMKQSNPVMILFSTHKVQQ